MSDYTHLIKLFQALAHPTRLRLIDELRQQSRTVTELTVQLNEKDTNVSRHLGILKDAGIVSMRVQPTGRGGAQLHLYQLEDGTIAEAFSVMAPVAVKGKKQRTTA